MKRTVLTLTGAIAALSLPATAPPRVAGDEIQINNPVGFRTLKPPEQFQAYWKSVAESNKMQGEVSDHLTAEQIETIYVLEVNISIAAGHSSIKEDLLTFLAEGNCFETGSLPEGFDKRNALKHIVALFRTRKGYLGLITRYKNFAVVEFGGRVGVAPVPVDAAAKRDELALTLVKDKQPPSRPLSVLIVKESAHSKKGLAYPTAISVADEETIDKLVAMFPGHDHYPSGKAAGGWEAGYRIYFNYPKERTVPVTVSRNDGGKTWSTGDGDLATKGDFNGLMSRIGPLTKGAEQLNGR